MTFERGDVVQVTWDNAPATEGKPRQTRHPFWGMIGMVTNIDRANRSVLVYFNFAPRNKQKETGLNGARYSFSPEEITKIGAAAVRPDFDQINSACDKVAKEFQNANPELMALIEQAAENRKWRHLPFGSEDAKQHGCICEDIRALECPLHGHTLSEIEQVIADTEKALDERLNHPNEEQF